LRKESPRP